MPILIRIFTLFNCQALHLKKLCYMFHQHMKRQTSHTILGWLMLVFIGTSMTFSTLHSHHHIKWDQTQPFANTGHSFTDNSTLCPICGYLFNANIGGSSPTAQLEYTSEFISFFSSSQQIAPFSGQLNGRSPPALI